MTSLISTGAGRHFKDNRSSRARPLAVWLSAYLNPFGRFRNANVFSLSSEMFLTVQGAVGKPSCVRVPRMDTRWQCGSVVVQNPEAAPRPKVQDSSGQGGGGLVTLQKTVALLPLESHAFGPRSHSVDAAW